MNDKLRKGLTAEEYSIAAKLMEVYYTYPTGDNGFKAIIKVAKELAEEQKDKMQEAFRNGKDYTDIQARALTGIHPYNVHYQKIQQYKKQLFDE